MNHISVLDRYLLSLIRLGSDSFFRVYYTKIILGFFSFLIALGFNNHANRSIPYLPGVLCEYDWPARVCALQ